MSTTALDAKAQAVILLARGINTDKVGEALGVTGRTVRRWREDQQFEADVRAARRALLGEAVAALGAAARDAIATLHAALTDDSAGIRIRAASVLIGALPSFSEHAELEERISVLETTLTESRTAA